MVVTSTEWENFFNLRCNSNTVQPEFVILANKMKDAMNAYRPKKLNEGEWHLPYIDQSAGWYFSNGVIVTKEEAIMHSAAACAQVSYRTLDMSTEKVNRIVQKLTDRSDPHLSPFEHQALVPKDIPQQWQNGMTHVDVNGQYWSGNFRGWIQNRQLMEQE